jgi:hypothetical protein
MTKPFTDSLTTQMTVTEDGTTRRISRIGKTKNSPFHRDSRLCR